MSDWIEPGKKAPNFSLTDDRGHRVKLSDFAGKPLIVYFYPRDDTPGCTREACSFRDARAELEKLGATVVGISADSVESHQAFKRKFKLNFPLLADADHKVAKKYGAWREKNMYGKSVFGLQRSTYLIDARGNVVKVWKNVKVDGHDKHVLATLQALVAQSKE